MCEIRYIIRDHSHKNPDLDKTKWKKGQILIIKEDGWGWSDTELNSEDAAILKMPGVSREKMKALYCDPLYNASDLISLDEKKRNFPRVESRRRYVIDETLVTPAFKASIESGLTSVTQKESALNAVMIDKAVSR